MTRQLHKGQLRYHHFLPLRALHNARQLANNQNNITFVLGGTGGGLRSLSTATTTTALLSTRTTAASKNGTTFSSSLSSSTLQQNQQQTRSFFTNLYQKLNPNAHLKKLEQKAVESKTAFAQVEFLRALNANNQYPAAQFYYENFIAKNAFVEVTPEVCAEYSTAMHRMGKKVNADHFIDPILRRGGGGAAAGAGGKGAMPTMQMPMIRQGASTSSPLYVEMTKSSPSVSGSVGSMIARLVGNVAVVFIVVSFIGVLLEDKGLKPFGSQTKVVQESSPESNITTFDDVKGVDEAKEDLEEVVEFLRNPQKFTRLGGTLPTGVLLMGPPGTGKTLLAKAVAGEASVPFFYASGSQFEEMYVGVGAKRIRDLFDAAKAKKGPCIIFIDEIDAVGGSRKLKDQSALKMTLNELLVQMDGFEKNSGIIVIGATNFADSLDKALLRPGRFDKHVTVHAPDLKGRLEILQLYTRNKQLASNVDLQTTARNTTGWTGAQLYNLINTAALRAAVMDLKAINQEMIEYARDKILMGAERKLTQNIEAASCTAYHEAGHALVAVLTPGSPPIHKATILPRGQALGMVQYLPRGNGKEDSTSLKFKEMMAYIDMAMGGRVAEELIFGPENISSGASNDIQQATNLARDMVTRYGFSPELGVVDLAVRDGELGAASEATRAKIDSEVKKILDGAYERATNLLKMHAKSHEKLAELLLEYETLTGEEVRALVLEGKLPVRDEMGQVIKKKADDVKDAAAATTRPRRFAARG
eukprot:CAMPEP_0196818356 /NCGR_PEP_ID=MMETSP1362-20130617/65173_1 /TAXON_ID=163516 /ORGANISM="Leptocylindrus danicus, Strain CCMP1856" /LENGTH=757 /DNA_ID=CAMNT_0042196423 /DNA_START=111 /DNA_END=2384 /DNA_ORIENTATION=-